MMNRIKPTIQTNGVGKVAFENNETSNVQIYDLDDKLIYSSAKGNVDFVAPQSGVYVLKINGVTKKSDCKIIRSNYPRQGGEG